MVFGEWAVNRFRLQCFLVDFTYQCKVVRCLTICDGNDNGRHNGVPWLLLGPAYQACYI